MDSISFDYRRGVEEDTRDQMPSFIINAIEEATEETKFEHEDKKKVVISELHKYVTKKFI